MPAGEVRRLQFKPGEPRQESSTLDVGDYKFQLLEYGKPGLAGWKISKPGKFPNRRLKFTVLDTEDEVTGSEKTMTDFASASPKAFFRIYDLALAAGYQEEIDVPLPTAPGDAAVREVCSAIDKVLAYIKDNNIVLNGHVDHEEYKGRQQARITNWLSPDAEAAAAEGEGEMVEEGAEAEATEGEEVAEEEYANGTEEEAYEEPAPAAAPKKLAARPVQRPIAKAPARTNGHAKKPAPKPVKRR